MMQKDLNLSKADGNDLLKWFVSGAKEVYKEVKYLNRINVYPVADGDTGSNLAATLRAMVEKPARLTGFGPMICEMSLSGMSGARGNSGVIFASYISGAAAEGRDYERVDVREFSQIMLRAVSHLYRSLESPVEGTMISVIREWAEHLVRACAKHNNFRDLFRDSLQVAAASLEKTKTILEVLRKNNVVDSGAAGFVRFLRGIDRFFSREDTGVTETAGELYEALPVGSVLLADAPRYRFCTEAALECPVADSSCEALAGQARERLRGLGDSLIVTSTANILKVHIHTDTPEIVMEYLRPLG